MDIVNNFDDLYRISDKWNPPLIKVGDLEMASDYINFPHEDYPTFIDSTIGAIEYAIIKLRDNVLTESDIRHIHTMCMRGKSYIRLGEYRMGSVTVSNELIPPQPYLIPQMLMTICPVDLDIDDIVRWYKVFETIHPFEDGNGRTGGVILAAVSYLNSGSYIVPDREYQYIINPIINRITNIHDTLLNNSRYFDQTLTFDNRCIQYIEGKLNNIKFKKLIQETDDADILEQYIMDMNIVGIKNLLNKIIND